MKSQYDGILNFGRLKTYFYALQLQGGKIIIITLKVSKIKKLSH